MDAEVAVDYQNADMGNSALHYASANGLLEVTKILLEHGASINLANNSKNTALHWASLCGQVETVKLLCEWHEKKEGSTEKADPNLKNEFGRVPMEEALQAGRSEVAEYLAPRTILEDDKLYSTIHESQIKEEHDEGDEEEKKELSDDRSMQSEEARQPDDYQRSTQAQK